MGGRRSDAMLTALAAVAPGTPLREGIDRVLQSGMGALVVIGDGPEVLSICSGGFLLDAAFSPQRLSELAKMDGAIVLAPDAARIARANVHLVPDRAAPTSETGTRHRTAERVARSVGVPVISVSEDMSIIAVYLGDEKHQLTPVPRLLDRANQAMKTLERYRDRLTEVSTSLSALEIEGLVTVRDVVVMLQRTEMVLRIADEIDADIIELGSDGRLFQLQLEEAIAGVSAERRLVVLDYLHEENDWHFAEASAGLADLDMEELLDLGAVAAVLHLEGSPELDASVQPKGYRMLSRIPRLPASVIGRVVERFGTLDAILRATERELESVGGVGDQRARAIIDGLARLSEQSILDRWA
ncbi:MAG: DNA integrity scanning protein DisA [Acidimicrobiia bacterium]|nr:DNA integrity scanning protein DisA [Acidimicrobiia bacterium]